jgi:hypothetical protein
MTMKLSKSLYYEDYVKSIDECYYIKNKTLELHDKWKNLAVLNITKPHLVSEEDVEKALFSFENSEGKLIRAKNNLIKSYQFWKDDEARIERLLEPLENKSKEFNKRIENLIKELKDYI